MKKNVKMVHWPDFMTACPYYRFSEHINFTRQQKGRRMKHTPTADNAVNLFLRKSVSDIFQGS